MAQIYHLEREHLQIPLKYNDDCVRLFSSFMSTLYQEIKEELNKYGKVIELFSQVKKVASSL
jgi:hypothetical protein